MNMCSALVWASRFYLTEQLPSNCMELSHPQMLSLVDTTKSDDVICKTPEQIYKMILTLAGEVQKTFTVK